MKGLFIAALLISGCVKLCNASGGSPFFPREYLETKKKFENEIYLIDVRVDVSKYYLKNKKVAIAPTPNITRVMVL